MKNNFQQQPPRLMSPFPNPVSNYNIHALSNLGKPKTEHMNSEHPFKETTSRSESAVSKSESCIIGSNVQHGLIKIDEGEKTHENISRKFISGLGALGLSTQIEAIHKNDCSSFIQQAKFQSFLIFSKAMEKQCGGNANLKYAWFGASRDEIDSIFAQGFGNPMHNGAYGHCICLSPYDHPLDCLQTAIPDKDGLRHLLLCRVILGRTEVVNPGSRQSHPCSEDFDTGVDHLLSPRKYIVWTTNMNSYVFPEFMISFRVTSTVKENTMFSVPSKFPSSPRIGFPALIPALLKFLPLNTVKLIKKYHSVYMEGKITRRELIQQTRKLAGDELLTTIIRYYKNKQNEVTTEGSSITSSINFQQWGSRNWAMPKQELE